MSYKWIMTIVVIVGLTVFVPVAQAQQTYDITECYSFTFTPLLESKELTALSYDATGIVQSLHKNKVFDNCTIRSVGIRRVMAGKGTTYGYFKYLDPDGDSFVMEGIAVGEDVTMKFIHGTGKWKDIKGEGKIVRITRGKPIMPSTAQMCFRHTGTFTLPKR
jgi:hypothetical protein